MGSISHGIPLGSHIYSPRIGGLYNHHGIYVGNGKVIQYSGFSKGFCSGPVNEISIESFLDGGNDLYIRFYRNPKFSPYQIVERAKSKLGEDVYNVFKNNCEHFSAWVHTDEKGGIEFNELAKKIVDVLVTVGPVPPLMKIGVLAVKGLYSGLEKYVFRSFHDSKIDAKTIYMDYPPIVFEDSGPDLWDYVKKAVILWQNSKEIDSLKNMNPLEQVLEKLKIASGKIFATAEKVKNNMVKAFS